jgi:hypothetical protein
VTDACADTIVVTQDEIDAVRRDHAEIIASGRQRVKQWIRERSARARIEGHAVQNERDPSNVVSIPRLLFVEGFLLYPKPDATNPSPPKPTNKNNNLTEEELLLQQQTAFEKARKEDQVHSLILTTLAQQLSLGETLEDRQMDFVQEHHYLSLFRAFTQLYSLLDIKLFLPTHYNIAKKRRMERLCYVDEKEGGQRKPGQMWKTKGYFEDVAWMHHVCEHGWIVDFDGVPRKEEGVRKVWKEKGVDVREEVDLGLEETVEWAVGVILDKLEQR